MRTLFFMGLILAMLAQVQSPAMSDDNSWLPLTRSEITGLFFGTSNVDSLKIDKSDVQKADLTDFLPADDTIWTASNAAIPVWIVMAGRDESVDSLRVTLPIVNYSQAQSVQVFAILAALFKRLYPDWADAAEWPHTSLLEAWKKSSVITKEISGITNATFGVPPDVVV